MRKKTIGRLFLPLLLFALMGAACLLPAGAAEVQTETFDRVVFEEDFNRFTPTEELLQKDYYSIVAKPGCKIGIADAGTAYGNVLKINSKSGTFSEFGETIAELSSLFVEWDKGCTVEFSTLFYISEDTFARMIFYDGKGGVIGVLQGNDTGADSVSVSEGGERVQITQKTALADGWVSLKMALNVLEDENPFIAFGVREGRDTPEPAPDGSHYMLLDKTDIVTKNLVRKVRDYSVNVFEQNLDSESFTGSNVLGSLGFTKIDQDIESTRIDNATDSEKRAINSSGSTEGSMLIEFGNTQKLLDQEFTSFMRVGPDFIRLTKGYYKISFNLRDSGVFAYHIAVKNRLDQIYGYVYFDSGNSAYLANTGGEKLDSVVEECVDSNPESANGGKYKSVTFYLTAFEDSYIDFTMRQYYPGERQADNCAWAVFDDFKIQRQNAPASITGLYADFLADEYTQMTSLEEGNFVLGENALASSELSEERLLLRVGTDPENAVLKLKAPISDAGVYKVYLVGSFRQIGTVTIDFVKDDIAYQSMSFDARSKQPLAGQELLPYTLSYEYDPASQKSTISADFEVQAGTSVEIRASRQTSMVAGVLELDRVAVLQSADNHFVYESYISDKETSGTYTPNGGTFEAGVPKDKDIYIPGEGLSPLAIGLISGGAVLIAAGAGTATFFYLKKRRAGNAEK